MNKRSLLAAAVAAAMCLPVGSAFASTAGPVNFTVTATLSNFCTISAANVAFGSISAGVAAANTSSSISLTCNKAATVSSIALDNGANASGTQKRMTNGTDFLNYKIDVPGVTPFTACPAPGAGPEWNGTNTIVGTSLFTTTGGAKPISICASIPAGQFPSAGAYSDTVSVTATYN